MKESGATDPKVLHALIDELSIYINMLKKSPHDGPLAKLFRKRFFRFGTLLSTCGYTDLSKMAGDTQIIFDRFFNSSIYATQQILQSSLSLLLLARKALIFSGTPDCNDRAENMLLEMTESLRKLYQCLSADRANQQSGSHALANKKTGDQ